MKMAFNVISKVAQMEDIIAYGDIRRAYKNLANKRLLPIKDC
jgi:hypothetical protein